MNFVADENIDEPIVLRLRQDGHVVWFIAEMEPGISDETVLYIANEQNAPLITGDKDFGELVFRLKSVTSGVILIRLPEFSAQQKAEIVSQVIEQHADELLEAFTVISQNSVRIRKISF
ncbi:MAG: hypothetical protein F6K24_56870 [Okeania sp. SIO2D1]|nr:hypothetical protein [Okeania sp. SIO2D1]